MITVMGATGRVGRRITTLLGGRGERVRAIGRTRTPTGPGVTPVLGDAADPGFLTEAFRDASAVFTMLPADPHEPDHRAAQDRKGEAIASAVRSSGVGYVVMLSSLGADLATGTGFIEGLHDQEERMRATGVALLILRPGWFLENVAEALPAVDQLGVLADSLAPDVAVPMVATRDVAAVAADALVTRERTGVVELLGPRDLTQTEVAAILGDRFGRPGLPYVQLPDAEMVDALLGAGFSPDAAGRHLAMTRAINEGRVTPRAGRTPANTTDTAFEDLVGELVG